MQRFPLIASAGSQQHPKPVLRIHYVVYVLWELLVGPTWWAVSSHCAARIGPLLSRASASLPSLRTAWRPLLTTAAGLLIGHRS
jgi:hypothetical protein